MFSIVTNVKSREIINQIASVDEFVTYLKDLQRPEVQQIQMLRELGKENNSYTKIKQALPAITFNFKFYPNYVKKENATEPTNFLYFDIDSLESFDYDTQYVRALWKSVGGKGFGLLVEVRNLIIQNFKESYEYVGQLLNIPYDKSCNDISRLNIISYDKEAYLNDDAAIIDLKLVNDDLQSSTEASPHTGSNKIKNIGYPLDGGGIRFNNLENVLAGTDYKFNKEGYYDSGKAKIHYCQCYPPRQIIPTGNRNTFLNGFANCIISINPEVDIKSYRHIVRHYNNKYCRPLLDIAEVETIINKNYKMRGKIMPRNNTSKRFLYRSDISTTKEKSTIANKVIGKERSSATIDALVKIVLDWNYEQYPTLTQKNLQLASGKNIKTIEKYYREVRDIVEKLGRKAKKAVYKKIKG